MIILKKENLSENDLNSIKKDLTFFDTDKKNILTIGYQELNKYLYLPTFYSSPVLSNYSDLITTNFEDDFKYINNTQFTGNFKNIEQENNFNIILNHLKTKKRGIYKATTGSGKTFLSIKIACELKLKTLIISASTNQIGLLYQWEKSIMQFTKNLQIGKLGDKHCDINDKDIIISTASSLRKNENIEKILQEKIGFIIIDECHHICSISNIQIFFKLGKIPYILGLSATPDRKDGLTNLLYYWANGLITDYKQKYESLPTIIKIYKMFSNSYKNHYLPYDNTKLFYSKMIDDIINFKNRNKLITDTIINISKNKERKILFLTDRIEHVNIIYDMINAKNTNRNLKFTKYIGTKLSTQEKQNILNNDNQIILSTCHAFGEGIDKNDLNTLILGISKKHEIITQKNNKFNSINFTQIIGRIYRKPHLNINPLIIDFADDFSVFKTHYYSRQRYYKNNLTINSIKIINFDLDSYKKINNENSINLPETLPLCL